MHFSQGTYVTYETAGEMLPDLRKSLEDVSSL